MGVIWEYLRARQALCFPKVLKPGLFLAESRFDLAEPALGDAAAKKCKKSDKSDKSPCCWPDEVESVAGEGWKDCPVWRFGAESGIVRCRNVRIKRTKRTKSAGRLATP